MQATTITKCHGIIRENVTVKLAYGADVWVVIEPTGAAGSPRNQQLRQLFTKINRKWQKNCGMKRKVWLS